MQPDNSKTQNRILTRLLEVSLKLNSNLELTPLLTLIMEAACEILHSEASSILLYNDKRDELRFVASNSPDTDLDQLMKISVPMEGSIAGEVVRTGQPIMVQDAMKDNRIYKPVGDKIGFVTYSLLAVPMRSEGKVVGVLEGVNKIGTPWNPDDVKYLSMLASHAAVAIQNASQSEALRQAYNELDELDKLKNDFIAIASHELRTPLGVILGYASFLQEEAQGEASEHAALVLQSALHLRNLIEDMVNLRYLQRGDTDLLCESMTVAALIDSVIKDVEATVAARGHRLRWIVPPEPHTVSVDRIKMSMALTNILNNAIKFTENGGTIVVVAEPKAHEILIKVTDDGPGLAKDQLDRVFEKFYQVADHMTRKHNGMGIGLAISKVVVEAHGGRIWAESPGLGLGSTFCVVIPLLS